jgi:hypothetical protein
VAESGKPFHFFDLPLSATVAESGKPKKQLLGLLSVGFGEGLQQGHRDEVRDVVEGGDGRVHDEQRP